MSDISLTASMRSNLLSLQQISKLQDQTQLRLSTGLKVNSAIDNPSSYYTASSLTNRADDLSALLDAMSQGIQTIKAATEGIETAEELIKQMKAIAEQVSSGSVVPEKSYFEKLVGENGAVVSTADELRAAVTSGKETICVYGNIDLGDISATGGLKLQENQKLVGVNYFGNFSGGEGFSGISATDSVYSHAMISIAKNGCLVSDLSLNYENSTTDEAYLIRVQGTGVVADLQNLDIKASFSDVVQERNRSVIVSYNTATINIKGDMNIEVSGYRGIGIHSYNKSTINISQEANVNIKTSGSNGWGIYVLSNASVNILGKINIKTFKDGSYGIINSSYSSGNNIYISSTAQIHLNTFNESLCNNYNGGNGNNILEITSGAKIAIEKNGNTKWYEVKEDYKDENNSTTKINTISADNIETVMKVAETSSWKTAKEIIEEKSNEEKDYILIQDDEILSYQKQFNAALSQYDMLIKDSAYKGINLLQEDNLKVNFNEDKSANLLVKGVDVTSESIGLLAADWTSSKAVQTSLDQVLNAQDKLRSASTQLGNYYSIITTRDEFTENLINVLEEGADKLTLADMNEESANMLSLQTRQQLAINSLSLASQASQAVLRLF